MLVGQWSLPPFCEVPRIYSQDTVLVPLDLCVASENRIVSHRHGTTVLGRIPRSDLPGRCQPHFDPSRFGWGDAITLVSLLTAHHGVLLEQEIGSMQQCKI